MSRTKIKIVGDLRNSDSEGLQYFIGTWDEVLPGTDDWPGLGQRPSEPKSRGDDKEKKALEDEWRRARAAYDQALHSDPESGGQPQSSWRSSNASLSSSGRPQIWCPWQDRRTYFLCGHIAAELWQV